MTANKPLTRICCVCRKQQPVAQMTRVVRLAGKFTVQSADGKRLNGRGCYVCPQCVATAVAKKALNRSFRAPVPDEVYQELASRARG